MGFVGELITMTATLDAILWLAFAFGQQHRGQLLGSPALHNSQFEQKKSECVPKPYIPGFWSKAPWN